MKHIFVINTHAGRYNEISNLREKLKKIDGLDYKVFNVQKAGGEEELTKKLLKYFDRDQVRLYCCGGSGTFCNVLNGIPDLSNVEVAFYPCGLTNDVLKCFGNDIDKFKDLEKLINGRVVEIDYMKANDRVFVNAFTAGLDSQMNETMENLRTLSVLDKRLPYLLSVFHAVFLSKRKKYSVKIDGEEFKDTYSEIAFGKGKWIGGFLRFSNEINMTDGKANVILIPKYKGFAAISMVLKLAKGDWEKVKNVCIVRKASEIEVEYPDESDFIANLDGEYGQASKKWKISVVAKGLKFVVPRGVKMYE